jgi:hypothetical protein
MKAKTTRSHVVSVRLPDPLYKAATHFVKTQRRRSFVQLTLSNLCAMALASYLKSHATQ